MALFTQDRFTITDPEVGSYTDAIILPQEEYDLLTPEDLEALKQSRFETWKQSVLHPVVQEIPPEAQLQDVTEKIDTLQSQIDDLTVQQDQLQAIIEQPTSDNQNITKGE